MSSAADDRIIDLMQRVIAQSVLTNERIARGFGLSVVDGQALGELARAGTPLTAGDFGARIRMGSSTTTRTVDRLEAAGFVRRVPDPADRRRVLVEVVPERLDAMRVQYDGLAATLREYDRGYSDAELDLVVRYIEGMLEVTEPHRGEG